MAALEFILHPLEPVTDELDPFALGLTAALEDLPLTFGDESSEDPSSTDRWMVSTRGHAQSGSSAANRGSFLSR